MSTPTLMIAHPEPLDDGRQPRGVNHEVRIVWVLRAAYHLAPAHRVYERRRDAVALGRLQLRTPRQRGMRDPERRQHVGWQPRALHARREQLEHRASVAHEQAGNGGKSAVRREQEGDSAHKQVEGGGHGLCSLSAEGRRALQVLPEHH